MVVREIPEAVAISVKGDMKLRLRFANDVSAADGCSFKEIDSRWRRLRSPIGGTARTGVVGRSFQRHAEFRGNRPREGRYRLIKEVRVGGR